MAPSGMSYEERMRHRAQFYAEHKGVERPDSDSGNNLFNFEFTTERMKFVSPYAVMIFLFTILFGVYALICNMTSHVSDTSLDLKERAVSEIQIPDANKIYQFDIVQSFFGGILPQYSELEIELLDEDHKHVYSVYKNLWMEQHPNGNGGYSVYNDLKMNFNLEFKKKGTYFVRAIAHNGNLGPVKVSIEKRTLGGGLYIWFYAIVFLVLSAVVYFGKNYWGNPSKLLEAFPSFAELKSNKKFLIVFSIVTALFVTCVVFGITHYGYASCGDGTILPTKFIGTDNLIYLG
ncbi:MAG: hypothetical protein HRT58_04495 [Crocinitomicaceae bacterium]|nr:hypothetical protein [Flavobacteriales bacterium]NQZ34896.1 hypothetical protein [Crocinitomicaceae bacterium]